jgi:hypothetical protein
MGFILLVAPGPAASYNPGIAQGGLKSGVWGIEANNFEGTLSITTIDNARHFFGTAKFINEQPKLIEGQYDRISHLVRVDIP